MGNKCVQCFRKKNNDTLGNQIQGQPNITRTVIDFLEFKELLRISQVSRKFYIESGRLTVLKKFGKSQYDQKNNLIQTSPDWVNAQTIDHMNQIYVYQNAKSINNSYNQHRNNKAKTSNKVVPSINIRSSEHSFD